MPAHATACSIEYHHHHHHPRVGYQVDTNNTNPITERFNTYHHTLMSFTGAADIAECSQEPKGKSTPRRQHDKPAGSTLDVWVQCTVRSSASISICCLAGTENLITTAQESVIMPVKINQSSFSSVVCREHVGERWPEIYPPECQHQRRRLFPSNDALWFTSYRNLRAGDYDATTERARSGAESALGHAEGRLTGAARAVCTSVLPYHAVPTNYCAVAAALGGAIAAGESHCLTDVTEQARRRYAERPLQSRVTPAAGSRYAHADNKCRDVERPSTPCRTAYIAGGSTLKYREADA